MSLREVVTGRLLSAETSREGDRVTTLELFFDLVYVFAFTQVTAIMSQHGDAIGVVQGLGALGLIWWSWTSFAWLANQAHADRGLVRIGMLVVTTVMFVVSLAMPEAFHPDGGGTVASTVFVAGILLVSVVHGVVYTVAAGTDAPLRRQIAVSLGFTVLPVAALLVAGALIGGPVQAWLWLAAPLIEAVIIFVTSHGGNWRIYSLAHFAERHGLVVMLALGESVVAIATGVAAGRGGRRGEAVELDAAIIVAAVIGVALALTLWWQYFDRMSEAVEHALGRRRDARRVDAITDVYTYLHLPLVAGIIIAALGVEQAMHAVESDHELGWFGAVALASGPALYLAMTGAIWARVAGRWSVLRLVGGILLLALIPALAAVHAIPALAIVTGVAVLLTAVERLLGPRAKVRFRALRTRPADPAAAP